MEETPWKACPYLRSCWPAIISQPYHHVKDVQEEMTGDDMDAVQELLFKLFLPSTIVGDKRDKEKGRYPLEH